MFKKSRIMFLLFLLFTVAGLLLAGCTLQRSADKDDPNQQPNEPAPTEKNFTTENRQLAKLLPAEEGYTWYYNGFAEYGHRMQIKSINRVDHDFTYIIEGEVDDPSGGEARNRDFGLQIVYTIANGVLTQVKQEEAMLDSEYDRLDLIKAPLEKGTQWTQKVVTRENNETELECAITDIQDVNGANVFTVMYRDINSDYYETREIKEGVGIISFEKLLVLEDQSFPAGYALYEEISGY